MNSKQIIEKCKTGNRKAQKVFYNQYVDLLFATLTRYIKDTSVIDDVLFQALMKIFTKLPEFAYINEKALVAWLKKVVINEALMHLRSDFRSIYKLEEITDEYEAKYFDVDDLNTSDLMETIELLPVGYRTVFLLHAVEGYSHKEIAIKLEIAEGTSRSQYFKARNLLQQKLKQDYGKSFGT